MHLPDQLTLNWIFLGSTVLLVSLSASLAVFFVSKRRREVLEARRITPTSFAPAISFFPQAANRRPKSLSTSPKIILRRLLQTWTSRISKRRAASTT
ncbi:hypothetical protein L596_008346 [Steinernema carpocapsae]|uniref:Uncharacterized protein n=1 Tax=Steinernema carpocapsae TaxID=34508 RepID=A0A4U5PC69_STECR|nr:hypothetical protein L596_008346 [Steinernema carpocapsae]